jgi:hypothetical protein
VYPFGRLPGSGGGAPTALLTPFGRRPGSGGGCSSAAALRRRTGSGGRLSRSNSGTRSGGGRLAALPVDAIESTLSREDRRPSLLLPAPTPFELAMVFVLGRRGGSLGVPASLTAVELAADGRRGGRVGRALPPSSSSAVS